MKKYQARKYCSGCHDEFYQNGGCGGANAPKQCWSQNDAKIIWRCMVSIDETPDQYRHRKKKRMASCYHKPRYCFPREVNE